jgi:hypothetical protein
MDAPRLRRIAGSAIVTTRLSRVVMNRARDVMARAQRVLRADWRGRPAIGSAVVMVIDLASFLDV